MKEEGPAILSVSFEIYGDIDILISNRGGDGIVAPPAYI